MIDVPAGTQPGEVFTLRGRGMPDVRYRGRGDLHVQITVEVPKRLSERHEQLLRELAEIEKSEVSPKRRRFSTRSRTCFTRRNRHERRTRNKAAASSSRHRQPAAGAAADPAGR